MATQYNEANHTDVNIWTSDNGRWKINERTEKVQTGPRRGIHTYLTVENTLSGFIDYPEEEHSKVVYDYPAMIPEYVHEAVKRVLKNR